MDGIDGNIRLYSGYHSLLHVIPAGKPLEPLENDRMMRHDQVAAPCNGLLYHGFRGIQRRQDARTLPGPAPREQARIIIRFLVGRRGQRLQQMGNSGNLHRNYCMICSIWLNLPSSLKPSSTTLIFLVISLLKKSMFTFLLSLSVST